MRIALIHDDFMQAGGAESLFATIASTWENAPIYTSIVDWNKLPASINPSRIRQSWLQKVPFKTFLYKILFPFYPLVFESYSFNDFDIVISSTTRFAKSIISKPKTIHICYINSLPRFLWDKEIQKNYLPKFVGLILQPLLHWLKRWDLVSSSRVDYYIANSQNIAGQLKKYYGYRAEVIYPFADLNFFRIAKIHNWQLKSQNYFLIVSRLVKWKKIDTAILAAQKGGFNLKIVGIGPDEARLKKLIATNHKLLIKNQIEFLGKVTKERLRILYQNSQALIISGQEDFGIAAVEAQACGVPVVAYKKSGVSEIMQNGRTGILFDEQSPKSIQDAIVRQTRVKWKSHACRENVLKFSKTEFITQLTKKIAKYDKRRK